MNKKESCVINSKKYYAIYTMGFAILALMIYGIFILKGKSFIFCDKDFGGDGLVQHFNAFVYYGNYLREIIKNIFLEHTFTLPMWDIRIGFGQDIITTLSYYVIGDPFALLSVFFPESYAEYGYCLTILLRIYFAGIAFSAFCRYKKHMTLWTLLGTFIYIFSSYTLYAAILHPYFVLPLIYLPLLFLGIEKILVEKKDSLFIFAVAISAISNFYFFYMLCIIVVIYIIFRYLEIHSFSINKKLGGFLGRFLLDGIIGVIMAAVLLFPSISNILLSSRISADTYVPLIYSVEYYTSLIGYFFMGGGSYYVQMGYTGVAFVAIIVLVFYRQEKREYFFSLSFCVLLMFFLLIPFIGHAFNGFSYVTNRWIWALAFSVAYITVLGLPLVEKITPSQWKGIWGIVIISGCMVFILKVAHTKINFLGIFMLLGTVSVIFVVACRYRQYLSITLFLLTFFSISINALAIYSPMGGNYIANFADSGEALTMLTQETPEKVLNDIEDDSIWRVDTIGTPVKRNSSMQTGILGTSFYFSSICPSISQFFSDMGMNFPMEHTYDNMDGRGILDSLLGVKYVIVNNENEKFLPGGYNQFVMQDGSYSVYQKSGITSISFSSEKYINVEEYEALSIAEKQEALLQGIVVDSSELEPANLEFTCRALDYKITNLNNVVYQDKQFIVGEQQGTVTLNFEDVLFGELYLVMNGLRYEGTNPEVNSVSINIETQGYGTELRYYTNRNSYYPNKHDFLCNLYYADHERNSITITFPEPGVYSFSEMSVVFQSMDTSLSAYNKLQEDILEDISIECNEISGTIDLNKNKLLCLSIPYSKGWTAVVDGKAVEVKKANNAFIAIEVPKGKHDISFYYRTPGLKESAMVSLCGILIYIGILVLERKRRLL